MTMTSTHATQRLLAAAMAVVLAGASAHAGLLYWDTNGTTAGAATGGIADGVWGGASASSFWSTDSAGLAATGTYVGNSDVVFSAGNDTTSALITVGTSVSANSLTFKEGAIAISGTSTVSVGAGGVSLANGVGPVSLSPLSLTSATSITNITLDASSAANGTVFTSSSYARSGVVLIRGTNLGTSTAGTANTANVFFGTAPTLTGTGAAGTTAAGVIAHTFGDTSASGSGAGFVTYDATKGVRLLDSSEYLTNVLTASQNIAVTGSVSTTGIVVNSLVLSGSGTIGGSGTVTVNSQDIFVAAGANATIAQSVGGSGLWITNLGDLSIGGNIAAAGGSAAKFGSGTLNLAGYVDGSFTVNDGLVVVGNNNAGTQKMKGLTINGGTFRYGWSDIVIDGNSVTLNGGALDLNGKSDTISTLNAASSSLITGGAGATGTLTVNSTATGTVAGQISGNLNLTKGSSGLLILTGSNTYTGSTTINGGVLKVASSNSLPGYNTPGLITTASGARLTVQMGGAGEWTSGNLDALTGNATFAAGSNLGIDTANATGTVTYASDMTGTFGVIKLSAGTLALSGNNSFAGGITISAGALVLSGSNSYAANTTLNGGTLYVNNSNALGTGALNMAAATHLGNSSGATVTVNNNLNAGGDIYYDGPNELVFASGTAKLSKGSNIMLYLGSGTVTFNNVVTATDTITTGSNGAVTFGNANSLGSSFNLSSGKVNVNHAGAFGSAVLNINGGALGNTSGGLITLNNNAQNWGGNFSFAGPNDLNLGTGAVAITGTSGARTVTVSTGTLTVGGIISATSLTAALVKSGSGTLVLNGANTYSGTTSVTGGTLVFGSSAAITGTAARPLSVSAGGAIALHGATNPLTSVLGSKLVQTSAGAIALDVDSSDNLDFNAAGFSNAALGAVGNVTYSGTLTPYSSGTYRLGSAGGVLTMTSPLTGANRVEITATSKVVLTGSNSHTGITNINAGATLQGSDATAYSGDHALTPVFSTNFVNLPMTGGVLELRANGSNDGNAQILTFGNQVQNSNANANFTVDVNRQADTGGTGKTIAMGNMNLGANNTLNVTGGNGFRLGINQLQLGGGPTTSTVTLNPTTGSLTIGSVGGGTNSANPVLKLDGTSADNRITGVIANNASGATSVYKSNNSTWTLSGSSSYTGGTLVSAGTLKAGNANAFSTGTVTLSGGVLDLRDFNVGNVINITGTGASVLLATSTGTLTTNFAASSRLRGWQRQSGVAGGNSTVAQLLGGTTGGAATVTSSWAASTDPTKVVSDVLDLKGLNGTTFVLQLNYADSGNGDAWEQANAYLGWLNGSNEWVNAVLGNNNGTGTPGTHYLAAYDSAASYNLGDYGVDAVNNTVWAVVNHNSDFAVVVPEPAMFALLGLGGLALLRRRKNG